MPRAGQWYWACTTSSWMAWQAYSPLPQQPPFPAFPLTPAPRLPGDSRAAPAPQLRRVPRAPVTSWSSGPGLPGLSTLKRGQELPAREQGGKMGVMEASLLPVYWFLHPSSGQSVQLLNNVAENCSGGQERGLSGKKKQANNVFKIKIPVKEKSLYQNFPVWKISTSPAASQTGACANMPRLCSAW